MPSQEAPCVELGNAPKTHSAVPSPSLSEVSSASSPEPQHIRASPLFRALAMPPPEPYQPPGQDELERRLPGYRRIVIPRELTLIELLKQCSGVHTDEEVLLIREATLRVVAERVGLRRLNVLAPRLRSLFLDGSAISSLRDLGIGLVHLKLLSVNRCGLTSLDGIWGFTVLKELHAANNKIHDLQPLGALQKLNTLNLANNPISESSRLWTLGVCTALRKLVLQGTPASESLHYRTQVANILPMLIYLDDLPLHTDVDYDVGEMIAISSESDSEDEERGIKTKPSLSTFASHLQSEPGPSTGKNTSEFSSEQSRNAQDTNQASRSNANNFNPGLKNLDFHTVVRKRRPNTTEGTGIRTRPNLPPRPQTANSKSNVEAPTKLQILNTLMDEEWRCSGSKLTSHGTVCGNLARALRQRQTPPQRRSREGNLNVEEIISGASRTVASEIPRANRLEDWTEFTQRTGIEIEIDFNNRPPGDAARAIERLEQIEMETRERLKEEEMRLKEDPLQDLERDGGAMSSASECALWNVANTLAINQECESDILL